MFADLSFCLVLSLESPKQLLWNLLFYFESQKAEKETSIMARKHGTKAYCDSKIAITIYSLTSISIFKFDGE